MSTAASPTIRAPLVAETWLTTKALSHVLVMSGGVCVSVAMILLVGFDGWEYYSTPLALRGQLPQHDLLRPSGAVGLTLGVAGVASMLGTLPYLIRKRWRRLSKVGTMSGWLEAHIFFGVVGPVLITFHTAFKFNGLVAVAYWLMMIVWASGFVGRYLYVRIPKTIRGTELSRGDVEQRLDHVRSQLSTMPQSARQELEVFFGKVKPADGRIPGVIDLFLGEFRARAQLALLRRQLSAADVDIAAVNAVVTLASERASLTRRLAHLQRTRRLFELWHVFHRPLVLGMFAIVTIHIGVALYFGYGRLAG
jgi:hypothetical protein